MAMTSSPRKRAVKAMPPPPPPEAERDHVAIANQYAQDVVVGKVKACKQVRQACKRQLSDLKRLAHDKNLHWDAEQAGRACRFIERLPHVKGPKAKAAELIMLEPWQCFVITTIFGWRRKDTGGRRFRRSYIEVPRGNAKSTLSSAVALYCLTADGEEGPEVYSAATTRDQAKIVFGDAQQMMRKRRDFAEKLGVYVNQHNIICPRINGSFWPLSRESGTMDGKNVHLAVIDELHAHKDRGIYDVIETGAAKRYSSLIWVITTAGSDTAGICYEVRTYVSRVLDGVIEDESQFGIVYSLDDDDDWTDPANWEKANPNWGVSVMADSFGQLAKKAMQVASAQNNFKTKHLNLWVNADVAWMDMRAWDRCGDPDLTTERFESGAPCVLSLDLATKTDIASKAKLFKVMHPKWTEGCSRHEGPGALDCSVCYPETAEHEAHYYLFVDNFLPEEAIYDGRNSQYQGWAIEGHLIETPGSVLDFGHVKQSVVEDFEKFNVREVPYDPWQTAQLAQELQEQQGIPMVEYRATVLNFSAPMKELEALVLQRRLHHNASPVMRWMVSNVVCHTDAKDNIYPRKEQPPNKIDGVVAAIMALGRALLLDDPYSDRGFLQL